MSPPMLQEAAAYWSQDLIGQVPDGNLPAWDMVTVELQQLLADFVDTSLRRVHRVDIFRRCVHFDVPSQHVPPVR
jgi:hypothetical protein